jgi:hypothetical protein
MAVQFADAQNYKLEGRGFNSRWGHWYFYYLILRAELWPWGWLSSYRNEYQGYLPGGKGGRYVGLTTLPHSYADYVGILEASNSWSTKGLATPAMPEL